MKNKGAFQVEYVLVAIIILSIAVMTVRHYYPVLSNSTEMLSKEHTERNYPTFTIDKMDGTSITNR